MIENLNRGTTVETAIAEAVRNGIDETVARSIGRVLKVDMIRLKKKRALSAIGFGALLMVGAPIGGLVGALFGSPFATFLSALGCSGGMGLIVLSIFRYATTESSVK